MKANVKTVILHTERNFPIQFEFVNTTESTRKGFNHKSEMRYWNMETFGNMYWTEKVHYINRTWETYQHRTAMIKTVKKAMDFRKRVHLRNTFLAENNFSSLRGHNKAFEEYCAKDKVIKDLEKALKEL